MPAGAGGRPRTASGRDLAAVLPGARSFAVLDLVLAAWVVVWVVLGIAIANEVRGLRQLSGTAVKVGTAVEQTGSTLDALRDAPFVGGRIGDAATSIEEAGRSTVVSGRQSRQSIHDLAWMLGLFVAVIPSVPLLAVYLPLRVAAQRRRRREGAA